MEITASKPRRGAIPALFFYFKKYTAQRITPALCGRFFICREKNRAFKSFYSIFYFRPLMIYRRKRKTRQNAFKSVIGAIRNFQNCFRKYAYKIFKNMRINACKIYVYMLLYSHREERKALEKEEE